MPDKQKVIKNTWDTTYCSYYDTYLNECDWSELPIQGVLFPNQAAVDAAIAAWGSQPQGKFVGENPPPR